MTDNQMLVKRLKKVFKVNKDVELAEKFEVDPIVFSSWKRSKGRLIEEIVRMGVDNDLDFNSLFHKEKRRDEDREVTVLMAEDLYSYYLNPEGAVALLPKYKMPVMIDSKLGFQVISRNMEPSLKVSSIVFGMGIALHDLEKGAMYVLHVANRGIYISRFKEQFESTFVFSNDNELFPDEQIGDRNIVSIYKVNAVLNKF